MSLRKQIFLIFIAITIATIVVVSFFHYRTARLARLEEVYNHMESLSEAKKLRMQGIIRKRQEQIVMMQIREQLRENFHSFQQTKSPDRQLHLTRTLEATRDKIPSFLEIHLLTMDGTVAVSSSPGYKGVDLSHRESFRHAAKGELCLHDFAYDEHDRLVIHMAGLLTLHGENIGVLIIKSDADDIISIINDYTGLGETGETIIAKRLQGRILFLTPTRFHQAPGDSLIVEKGQAEPMANALAGKEALLPSAVDYRNEQVVASTRFLGTTQWGLVTKIDRKEALAPVRSLLYNTLILVLLLASVVTVMAHFFSRRLIRPVVWLSETTREIAAGNLEKRIQYSSRNEVGQLAMNFNLMADKLVETNKVLERKLEELDRINDSLNRFAHVVSHDLKSPLHSINGLIALLQETLAEHENPEVPKMLTMAEGKAKHMLDLIAGILHYSMAGVIEETREPVPVKSLVEDVIQQLEVPAHIRIEVEELPVVLIERVLILQVFQNLINNAIKYMDKPIGLIRIGSVKESVDNRFYVQDNGRGIEARNHEKVFDIFNKTQRIPGIDSSGIGLSIVKKIVESKGGRIWVESEIGAGSTFFFTLPPEGEMGQ
jgi:signal transduction histidine kinase